MSVESVLKGAVRMARVIDIDGYTGTDRTNLKPEYAQRLGERLLAGDSQARDEFITSHMKLAHRYARYYKNKTPDGKITLEDLVAEGWTGLCLAMEKYDPKRGISLSAFAAAYIQSEILSYILTNYSLICFSTGAKTKELFNKLRRTKARIEAGDSQLSDTQVLELCAQELGSKVEKVREVYHRLSHPELSFSAPIDDSDGDGITFGDTIADTRTDPGQECATRRHDDYLRQSIRRAMPYLSDRQRHVINRRWFHDQSEHQPKFDTIAQELFALGLTKRLITRQRAQQIEDEAMAEIRRIVTRMTPDGYRGVKRYLAATASRA